MAAAGQTLFVAGETVDGDPSPTNRGVFRWSGTNWSVIGTGLRGEISVITRDGSDLFVAGRLSAVGGVAANNIARWDGASWHPLGEGVGSSVPPPDPRFFDAVSSVAIHRHRVFVAGAFTTAGGRNITNLAQWDRSGWSAVGRNLDLPPGGGLTVTATDDALFLSGFFAVDSAPRAITFACWDGSKWREIPWDPPNLGRATGGRHDLFVGTDFERINGRIVNSVAHWDGRQWQDLDGGLQWYGRVNTLEIQGSSLLVGGRFHTIGGVLASNIARWDGTNFSPLGNGFGSEVYSILATPDRTCAASLPTKTEGVYKTQIQQWDGKSWTALGNPLDLVVKAFAEQGSNVFVGGKDFFRRTSLSDIGRATSGSLCPMKRDSSDAQACPAWL